MYLLKSVAGKFTKMQCIERVKAYALIAFTLFIVSCGNNQKTAEEKGNPEYLDEAANVHILNGIVNYYLALSEALSNDNSELAGEESGKLLHAAKELSENKNKSGNDSLRNLILPEIIEDAEHIEKNADDIGHQRMHFVSLTSSLIELINVLGTPVTLHEIHCPMYYKSSGGADWLSKSREFQNPYLGSKMNSCGVVKKTILSKLDN